MMYSFCPWSLDNMNNILYFPESRQPMMDKQSPNTDQVESRKKAAKMLVAVVIMFGLCFFPVHLLNIVR